jgi:hypothetical protein
MRPIEHIGLIRQLDLTSVSWLQLRFKFLKLYFIDF